MKRTGVTQIGLLWACLAFCLFGNILRYGSFFYEFTSEFLRMQLPLLLCLVIWSSIFFYLTWNRVDLFLVGFFLVSLGFYLAGYKVARWYEPDAFIPLAGATFGRVASFLLGPCRSSQQAQAGGNQECLRDTRHLPSAIFLAGLVLLLAFSSFWHLDSTNNPYHGPRWMGLWKNPNEYGILMGIGLVLAIGLLWANRNLKMEDRDLFGCPSSWLLPLILFGAALMMAAGLLFSYSRGAWLGFAAGLLYLSKAHGRFEWRYLLPVIVIISGVAWFFWNATPETAPWYVKRLDLGRPSAQHRVAAWRAGVEIMRDHPLGVGWNNSEEVYEEDYSPPEGGGAAIAMNDYLMLGTQLGWPGLTCFVLYCAACLKRRNRFKGRNLEFEIQIACRAGALAMLVAFWFDGGLFNLATTVPFWIMLELGAVKGERRQRNMDGAECSEPVAGGAQKGLPTEHRAPVKATGFTILELLVVIAVIAILAALLLPVLSQGRKKAQAVTCLSNLGQLSAACKMYADDDHGELVSCWPIGWGTFAVNPYSWCPGWASFQEPQDAVDGSYGPSPQFDCTNNYALEQGAIWQYVKAASVYRCPSDDRTFGGWPVVRSYSMNSWIGGRSNGDPTGSTTFMTPAKDGGLTYAFFRTENQIRQPSQIWSLIDEDGSTINDSMFIVDMGDPNEITDLPAVRHGRAFGIAFADGHVEANKWLESASDWENQDPPDADWLKLKEMTTVEK
ncbi:MAG TPA: O-antigen ligase family protein [Verrucomicrobiae bacterium]|nr:O-antigen ligase family protein [Verrucomicrobiae bacterium]